MSAAIISVPISNKHVFSQGRGWSLSVQGRRGGNIGQSDQFSLNFLLLLYLTQLVLYNSAVVAEDFLCPSALFFCTG